MGEQSKRIEMAGKRYGRLVGIRFIDRQKRQCRWLFKCDCGTEKIMFGANVRRGLTTSCGCRHREISKENGTSHGLSKTAEYDVWGKIKDRCLNPANSAFKNYGARGITICPRWQDDFAAFFSDMGPRPSPQHAIERVDNDRGYSPDNSVWLERRLQNENRRCVRRFDFRGGTLTIRQLAESYGVPIAVLTWRIEAGWPINRAVLQPVRRAGEAA